MATKPHIYLKDGLWHVRANGNLYLFHKFMAARAHANAAWRLA